MFNFYQKNKRLFFVNGKKMFMALLICLVTLSSCEKTTSKSLNRFYTAKINGSKVKVYGCGTSDMIAEFRGDTILFIGFGCGGQSAGFYLKGNNTDGNHTLGMKDYAFYGYGSEIYQTRDSNAGMLTIKSSVFTESGGNRIPTLEGTFSFTAIDKNSGKTVTVTNGKFLLKKQRY